MGAIYNALTLTLSLLVEDSSRHVQKARIQSHDTLADALETCYKRLKEIFEKENDLDQEIKVHQALSLAKMSDLR